MAASQPPARAPRRGRSLLYPALAVALALLAGPAVAQAAESAAGPGAVAGKVVAKSPEEIAAYWTPRRMRQAEPLDTARVPRGDADPAPMLHAGFESNELTDTTSYPNRAHGKVFFKIGTAGYVCSGTVVPSAGDDLVLTAGHCVYDAGGTDAFVTNFAFVPGYRNGNRPYGTWPAEALATTTGWQAENFNYDVAFANVAQVGGSELENVVGARGIGFNQPRDQDYDAFGYPAVSPFDGQKLWVCDSSYFGDDPHNSSPGPSPMGIGCDMTGGASGGGWVIAGGHIASVTSFGYNLASEQDHLYGPYFGSVAKTLYASVDGATETPSDLVAGADAPPDSDPGPDPVLDTWVEAPRVKARKRQRQGGRRIVVELRAGAGEHVLGTARGRITVKGLGRSLRLDPVTRSTDPGELGTYRLRLATRSADRRVFGFLDRGRTVRSHPSATLEDEAGNAVSKRRAVRLR